MTVDRTMDGELLVSPDDIADRRALPEPDRQVMFRLAGLWGVSDVDGMQMPLNSAESIKSGQVCIMLDPDSGPEANLGVMDYERHYLRVRYGVQMVFPELYNLITEGRHDPGLLSPVRAVATDDCEVLPDYSGWRALGKLDFLPGSLWAGASGG
ncbi:hypothetical protein AB0B85_01475 [Micromonospora sp. NPDC049044]|uniref:hypothetical protein n=1 Tax=unclassified Micromonospora TaxID=2617518 RepID=UPI0033F25F1C